MKTISFIFIITFLLPLCVVSCLSQDNFNKINYPCPECEKCEAIDYSTDDYDRLPEEERE